MFARERVELLIELFWEVRESKHLAAMPLPLAHFFQNRVWPCEAKLVLRSNIMSAWIQLFVLTLQNKEPLRRST